MDIGLSWLGGSWQFEHLNTCRHGSLFFVSSLGGFVFSFTLQHHLNSWWFSDLWGPLHLTYLDPWILQKKVVWPYFQQFLYWGMPRFILAPLMIAIYLLMLKHQFIKHLALLPLWTSQMSIHIIDMSNLGNILITLGLDTNLMLSKIWFCLRIALMSLKLRWSWDLPFG